MEMTELNLEELLGKKDKKDVWDDCVPIIKDGLTTHAYMADEIGSPDNYNKLCHELEIAEPDETVVLHLNTGGGYIDSAFKVIASIKRCKAVVVARLTGTVASAGTIIALSCDELEVEDFTSFMVHNYSGGAGGKGHEIIDYVNFSDKNITTTFKKLYSGFLTTRELNAVIKGKDMWMGTEEVQKRWVKMKDTNNVEDSNN
jgi:ATP-dependent protease ClpP protease subunit